MYGYEALEAGLVRGHCHNLPLLISWVLGVGKVGGGNTGQNGERNESSVTSHHVCTRVCIYMTEGIHLVSWETLGTRVFPPEIFLY